MHSSPDQNRALPALPRAQEQRRRTGRAFARTELVPGVVASALLIASSSLYTGCFAQIDEARERARAAQDASDGVQLDVVGPSVDAGVPTDVSDSSDAGDISLDIADTDTDSSDGSGDIGDADGFDVPRPPVEFGDIERLFESTCTPCHTDRVSGGLSLLANPELHARLLSPSVQLPSMARVTPGDPGSSYLWLKLEGTHAEAGGLGEPMPLGETVSTQQRDLLRRWIEQGATAGE